MKRYLVKFKNGDKSEVWASNAHNAKQIAIGFDRYYTGREQSDITQDIVSVELVSS